jgi:hypothetical protein
MKLDVKIASVDALDAVKSKSSRICPLICDHGFKADGDRCTRITCRAGYEVGDDNTCEKIEVKKPTVRHEERAIRVAPDVSKPANKPLSGIARADQAYRNGTYQNCMGAQTGCYARALKYGEEHARQWCSRRPTC